MNKEKYEEVCDGFSDVVSTMLCLISKHLAEEYNIELRCISHIAYFNPDVEHVRSSSLAIAEERIIKNMLENLEDDLKKSIKERREKQIKQDIKSEFEVLEKKKPFLN